MKDNPDVIVLLDSERVNVDFNLLQRVAHYTRDGIRIRAASGFRSFSRNSQRDIDTGSFVALRKGASDRKGEILGKPAKLHFAGPFKLLDGDPRNIVVVGDDWSNDILDRNAAWARTNLLRSGKYQPSGELKCQPPFVTARLMDVFSPRGLS